MVIVSPLVKRKEKKSSKVVDMLQVVLEPHVAIMWPMSLTTTKNNALKTSYEMRKQIKIVCYRGKAKRSERTLP